MADIKLFSISGPVKEMEASVVELERNLQRLIEQNMPLFFGVTFLKSEYIITNGRMDSLGIDENNCPVIFEYKRSVNENVINQGLFYLDWLLDHKADFKFLVMENLGREKADAIDWSMPCVICIANDFTKFDEHAVNQMQRNIKLVRYKNYGNELILFEFLNTPQAKPVMSSSDPEILSQRGSVPKDKTFAVQLEKAPQEKKDIYMSVRDYILSISSDDVSENQLKLYMAFRKVQNIVCVEVYKHVVLLHLRLNPDTVDLKKGFTEDVRTRGHWGTGDLRVILKTMSDFESCKPLLLRAYLEN